MGLLTRLRPRLATRRAVGDNPGSGAPSRIVDYRDQRGTVGGQVALGIGNAYLVNHNGGLFGEVRYGEPAMTRYAGDLGPLQRFTHGVNVVGSAATIRPGMATGLPATSTVPGQPPGDMLALLMRDRRFDRPT